MPSESILIEKKRVVEELTEKLRSQAGVFVNYSGITVNEDTEMRVKMREANVDYTVIKNTLMRFAIKNVGFDDLDPILNGTTSLAVCNEDPVAPARIIKEYADKLTGYFEIKGGFMDGRILSVSEVNSIAAIPPLPILQAQLLGTMLAPIASLAVVLKAIAEKDGAPVDAELKATEEAPAPVEAAVEAPVEEPAPVEAAVEAPVEEAPAPVEAAVEAPVEEAPAPVEAAAEAPVEEAPAPVEAAVEAPVEEPAPVEAAVEASVEEPAPVEAAVEASVEEPAPAEAVVEAPVEEPAPAKAKATKAAPAKAEEAKPEVEAATEAPVKKPAAAKPPAKPREKKQAPADEK